MLQFHENINMDTGDWHSNLSGKLKKNNVFKWKSSMNKKDINRANYICKNLILNLGYKIDYNNYGLFTFLTTLPGILYARVLIFIERLLFYHFPLRFRSSLLKYYRIFTKSIDME